MKKGFTLIELMIVVVIIGILAAIAIPNFLSMQQRAKESVVKTNMHTVQLTAEDYNIRKDGQYPIDGTSTAIGLSGAVIQFANMMPSSLKNPYTGVAVVYQIAAASVQGQVGYSGAITGYTITGYGSTMILPLTLRPGISN